MLYGSETRCLRENEKSYFKKNEKSFDESLRWSVSC